MTTSGFLLDLLARLHDLKESHRCLGHSPSQQDAVLHPHRSLAAISRSFCSVIVTALITAGPNQGSAAMRDFNTKSSATAMLGFFMDRGANPNPHMLIGVIIITIIVVDIVNISPKLTMHTLMW